MAKQQAVVIELMPSATQTGTYETRVYGPFPSTAQAGDYQAERYRRQQDSRVGLGFYDSIFLVKILREPR